MLEVKNLSKIYRAKSKDGVDTKALDGVSLSFAEKGMVFLLGKSGSGKSTLLNICGGLDSPSSGEIIVKGKSSKDFSQTDFDSYRNTFVGFIFQEYNILNEFSVEDNIALALELQGKPKDKKVISELLEQVDLSGFAKRKPNTLSGGQKQRIAIARALVKAPEIIMADEPTGALDSATGKQVFDTLKKLSKDKLVLVVSHDRDFAEQYGDRIIELKDGQVLSDVSKTEMEQQPISANVSTVGDVLCIKKDAQLGDQEFEQIKAFLRSSKSDVIIANNENDVAKFKKASRINESGSKEVFVDTDESAAEKKSYRPEDSKFIRSKLPMRHAVKIGASSLKSKPVRLLATVLLCAISFTLFGMLSTLNFYDSESTFKKTMENSQRDYVVFEKQYQGTRIGYTSGIKEYEYKEYLPGYFSSSDIQSLSANFGGGIFGGVSTSMEYNIRSRPSNYWMNDIRAAAYIPDGNPARAKVQGEYPKGEGEICISSYAAEMLFQCKPLTSDGGQIDVSSANGLIGHTVIIGSKEYKIVGIFDSGIIEPKYDGLKTDSEVNYALLSEFESALSDGMHLTAFFSESDIKSIANDHKAFNSGYRESYSAFVSLDLPDSYDQKVEENKHPDAYYTPISSAQTVHYFDATKTSISNDEIVLSSSIWARGVMRLLQTERDALHSRLNADDLSSQEYDAIWEEISKLDAFDTMCYAVRDYQINEFDSDGNYLGTRTVTEEEYNETLSTLIAKFGSEISTVRFAPADNNQLQIGEEKTYRIVGIATTYTPNDYQMQNSVYLSDAKFRAYMDEIKPMLDYYIEFFTNYVAPADGIYNQLYAPYSKTEDQNAMLWSTYSNDEYAADDSKISLAGSYIYKLENIDSMVKSLSTVFLYVGLAFAVFSILLFSNFISVSISQKKKEIGILRAVGARGTDVFKIFFAESFFIAIICTIISCIGSFALCEFMNKEMAPGFGASIFVFGISSILIIVAIATLTAVLSTFLPVWSAAKKKPVDSIRSL